MEGCGESPVIHIDVPPELPLLAYLPANRANSCGSSAVTFSLCTEQTEHLKALARSLSWPGKSTAAGGMGPPVACRCKPSHWTDFIQISFSGSCQDHKITFPLKKQNLHIVLCSIQIMVKCKLVIFSNVLAHRFSADTVGNTGIMFWARCI